MADQINDGFTDIQERVGEDVDNKFDSVEGMIGDVDGKIEDFEGKIDVLGEKLDVVENSVNDMDGKFDGVETYVDNRLDVTEEHLATGVYELRCAIDHRFKLLEKRMDYHFEDIRTLSHNGLCHQGWQHVKPVWGTNAQGNRALPLHFPHTVVGFWDLKNATKSECENGLSAEDVADLIGNVLRELLRFYRVRGFGEWSTRQDDPSLAQGYQDLAHQALAIELGLSYEAIQANMERKPKMNNTESAPTAGPSQGTKRRRVDSGEAVDPPRTPTAALPTQPVARRTRAKRTK